MERLFLSVEQAKHLQELGMDMGNSACCWIVYRYGAVLLEETPTKERAKFLEECHDDVVHTFSLQELLENLPKGFGLSIDNESNLLSSFYDSLCEYYESIKEKEERMKRGEYEGGLVFDDIDPDNMKDYTIIKTREL